VTHAMHEALVPDQVPVRRGTAQRLGLHRRYRYTTENLGKTVRRARWMEQRRAERERADLLTPLSVTARGLRPLLDEAREADNTRNPEPPDTTTYGRIMSITAADIPDVGE
jgi:hypothetical protein